MRQSNADFTNTFRSLCVEQVVDQTPVADPAWHQEWRARRSRQPQSSSEVLAHMRAHNPAFIPRNHKVEEALEAAGARADFGVMQQLLAILATPYDPTLDKPEYRAPPAPGSDMYQTYCGT